MRSYRLIATGMLAGLAIALQFLGEALSIQTGFGMRIDLVGVPILLALFLFGFEAALDVLIVVALAISIAAPTGFIGAIMKFAATLPMIIVPPAIAMALHEKRREKILGLVLLALLAVVVVFAVLAYSSVTISELAEAGLGFYVVGLVPIALMVLVALVLKKTVRNAMYPLKIAAAACLLALLVRGVAMVIANAYFAGPLFFKMSPHDFISFVESQEVLLFGKGGLWFLVIFLWNAVQGALEFAVAWFLAFKAGFFARFGELQ